MIDIKKIRYFCICDYTDYYGNVINKYEELFVGGKGGKFIYNKNRVNLGRIDSYCWMKKLIWIDSEWGLEDSIKCSLHDIRCYDEGVLYNNEQINTILNDLKMMYANF